MRVGRPHLLGAVVATAVALGGLVVATLFGQLEDETSRIAGVKVIDDPATATERLLLFLGAALLLLGGVAAVRSVGTAVRRIAIGNQAEARGATLAFVISLFGYSIVLLAGLGVVGVNLEGLLVGGALTGVVVGIAAQQTIGNFFAGIVLMAAKPFVIGDTIVLRSGPLGGEYHGTVTNMSLFYVALATDAGEVLLPNSGVLSAAIGPGTPGPTP